MSKGGAIRWTPERLADYEAKRALVLTPTGATSKQRMQALGRMKVGAMNKTETAYAATLEQRKQAGEVVWFKFEGMKFRLADNTFYTPDFVVLLADGALEAHEVKGARAIFQDDAKAKVKIAADMYPLAFVVAFPIPKNKGGGWEFDRY